MENKLYKGTFNWHGESFTLYTQSPSEEQAFRFLCKKISEKLGHATSNTVRHYFYDTDKYEIKEVISNDKGFVKESTECRK